jgi:hypothetical protein
LSDFFEPPNARGSGPEKSPGALARQNNNEIQIITVSKVGHPMANGSGNGVEKCGARIYGQNRSDIKG